MCKPSDVTPSLAAALDGLSCLHQTQVLRSTQMGVAVSSMDISGCTRLRWDRVRTVLPEARLQRLDLRGGPSLELLTPEGATRVFNQLAAAAETISCSIGLDASHPHAHAAPNLPQHDELHAPLQAILLSPIPWFVDMLKALQSFSTDAEAVFEGCTLDLSDLAANRRTSHLFVHEFDAGKPALIEALSCPDRSRLLSTLSVLTLPGGLISNGEEEAAVFARAITSHAWLDKLVVRDIGYSPDLRPRLATQDVELPIGALRRNELVLLDLSRKRLGPRLAILLAAALPPCKSLRSLILDKNRIAGREGLNGQAEHTMGLDALGMVLNRKGPRIATLSARRNKLGPRGAAALVGGAGRGLVTLVLSNNFVGGGPGLSADLDGVSLLASAVHACQRLTLLDVSCNMICPEGAAMLAEALSASAGLRSFMLGGNGIGGVDTEVGMSAVGRLLSSRAVPLRRLDLSYNGITSKDVEVLCGALRTNRTLNTLNLEGNPAEGSGALVGAIASLESLTCITLTPEVEVAITPWSRNTLLQLDLSNKKLDSMAGTLLAAALPLLTSLRSIDVSSNLVYGEAARQLALGALAHPALRIFSGIPLEDVRGGVTQELDLTDRQIGVPGAWVLSTLLVDNAVLSTLNLSGAAGL
ncbi:hypothetical protein CYMTET_43424 [Cymbomonas tetramitiformis]|uniref:Uncharacterized protein n=1 Tax=Cymbomonas tetramitiformis TaxID=36881 RepID=A0AAE0F0M9_9CHLO|nr:hypothetical protein CYMTET_43424 [Cymbomonas tetramitiformis]